MKRVNKHLVLGFVLIFVFGSLATVYATPFIMLDNVEIVYDDNYGRPFIDENGRTQVPLRKTMEEFGAIVSWNQLNKTAVCEKNGITIEIPVGERYVLVDGKVISNDTEAVIINNRVYVPIRVIVESFNGQISWNSECKTVSIFENAVGNIVSQSRIVDINDFKYYLSDKDFDIHAYYEYGQTQNNEPISETITVKKLDRPAVILLYGYEPIDWTVQAEDPNDIIAVWAEGYYEQKISNTGLVSYTNSYETGGSYYLKCGREEQEQIVFAEKVNQLIGHPLKTLWNLDFEIDGINSLKVKVTNPEMQNKVVLEHVEDAYFDDSIIPYGENIAGYTGVWWDSNFKTNQGYLDGKYYFEVEVTVGGDSPDTWTNLGICTDAKDGRLTFNNPYHGEEYGEYAYGALGNVADGLILPSTVSTGDIIGVAMDLDNGRVYFSMNGHWFNGEPTDCSDGKMIKTGRVYYACSSIGEESDLHKFLFKKDDLKYTIPSGYKPYDMND